MESQEGSVRFDQPASLGQLLHSVINRQNPPSSSNEPYSLMQAIEQNEEYYDDSEEFSVFARLAQSVSSLLYSLLPRIIFALL